MKFGLTSLTLKDHSPAEVIRLAKEAGLDGIEWGVSDEHMPLRSIERAEEIRKLSKENGITRRRPAIPQRTQLSHFGAFLSTTRNSKIARTIQQAETLILKIFKKISAITIPLS